MIVSRDSVSPVSFDGLHIYEYTAGLEASSSLAVVKVPPGARHKMAYSTRSDKYYYLMEGRLQFTVDGEEYQLNPGDFCLVKCGQQFGYENKDSQSVILFLVHTPSFDIDAEVFVEQ